MQSLCYSSPQQLEFCRTHQHTSCRFCGRIGGQLVQLIDCRGDQGNATVWDRKMMAEEIAVSLSFTVPVVLLVLNVDHLAADGNNMVAGVVL